MTIEEIAYATLEIINTIGLFLFIIFVFGYWTTAERLLRYLKKNNYKSYQSLTWNYPLAFGVEVLRLKPIIGFFLVGKMTKTDDKKTRYYKRIIQICGLGFILLMIVALSPSPTI